MAAIFRLQSQNRPSNCCVVSARKYSVFFKADADKAATLPKRKSYIADAVGQLSKKLTVIQER